jgi:RNA polymerase sigma-70 factor (ECF subfamily)
MSQSTARREESPLRDLRPVSDETLALQSRRNPQLFAELYSRYMKRIYNYHLARTGNMSDAEDLTSQTFLAALEHLENYDEQRVFSGWLFGIANHKLVDHYRRKKVNLPMDAIERLSVSQPSPEESVTNQLQVAQVAKALRNLAPDQAEAVTLRIFAELSAMEVGRVMGKSEAAVKMLVHRGLQRLKEKLAFQLEVRA